MDIINIILCLVFKCYMIVFVIEIYDIKCLNVVLIILSLFVELYFFS